MPFNGSGTYLLPSSYNPVVTGTTISSTAFNATMIDVAGALSNTLTKDGQNALTANFPMGGFGFSGLGNGTAGAPTLGWSAGDGFYRPATGTVAVAAGGTQIASFSSGGAVFPTQVFFGNAQTTALDQSYWAGGLRRYYTEIAGDGSTFTLNWADGAGNFAGTSLTLYRASGQLNIGGTPLFTNNLGGGYGGNFGMYNVTNNKSTMFRINPAQSIEILRSDQSQGNFTFTDLGAFSCVGAIQCVGSVNIVSLAATKQDVVDLPGEAALEKIMAMLPRLYSLKLDPDKIQRAGLIVEETPEGLHDGESVDLYGLLTTAIAAIQHLARKLA